MIKFFSDTFSNPCSPHHEIVMIVLKRLQGDKDRDVRFFASLPPHTTETHYVSTESSNKSFNYKIILIVNISDKVLKFQIFYHKKTILNVFIKILNI